MIINKAGGNLVECNGCGRRVPELEARDTNLRPINDWVEMVASPAPHEHYCPGCWKAREQKRAPAAKANIKKLDGAMLVFADRMLDRLIEKANAGYTGWDGGYSEMALQDELLGDVELLRQETTDDAQQTKLAIDIANRAMMIWYRHRSLAAAAKPRRMQACPEKHCPTKTGGTCRHFEEHDEDEYCTMKCLRGCGCEPVIPDSLPLKPRRMKANTESGYSAHSIEHDETFACRVRPVCEPVEPEDIRELLCDPATSMKRPLPGESQGKRPHIHGDPNDPCDCRAKPCGMVDLLNRVVAGMQTPGDLSDREKVDLIEDLETEAKQMAAEVKATRPGKRPHIHGDPNDPCDLECVEEEREAQRIEDERTGGISGILAHQEQDAEAARQGKEQLCRDIGQHNTFCKLLEGHEGAHYDGRRRWGADKSQCNHRDSVSGCVCQLIHDHSGAHSNTNGKGGHRWDNPCGHEHAVGLVCTRLKGHASSHADARGATWYSSAAGPICRNRYGDRNMFCERPAGHQGKHRMGQAEWWFTESSAELSPAPKQCGNQRYARELAMQPHCLLEAGHQGPHRHGSDEWLDIGVGTAPEEARRA